MYCDQSLRDAYLKFLIEWEVLDEVKALDVLDQQQKETPPIGRLALKEGILDMKQIFSVLGAQVDSDLKFGEIAISLGFMTLPELEQLLTLQKNSRPGLNLIVTEMGLAKAETLQSLHKEFLSRVADLVI